MMKLMKMNMIMTFEEVNDVDNENCKENNEEDHKDKGGDEAKFHGCGNISIKKIFKNSIGAN